MPADVIETAYGRVRGVRQDGVLAFLGIPYARANRFEAPVAPEPWAGVRAADAFGPLAPQSDPANDPPGYGIILEQMGFGGTPPGVEDEDCQRLNVWTADPAPDRLRPVMVWLHPGFFMVGSGASGNGAKLAARGDVVVISLNHRLNLFGFTHLDDIAPGFRQSGNAGMLDIVMALAWVQDNIASFGGDPRRVMVFGASGGGMKTAWLMASPAATGLIHRAGSQSGPCLRIMERDEASAISGRLLADVGLTSATVNDLRRMDVRRLLHAYHRIRIASPPRRFTHLAGFAPVIDPTLMPRHPFAPNSAPQAAAVPLLIGWNREDMAFFPGRDTGLLDLDEAGVAERVERLPIADAPRHLAAYRADDPDASPSRLLMRLVSDWSIGAPVLAQAARHSAAGRAPVFAYRFDHSSPALGGRVGAVHSSETGYVFATGGPFADPSPDAQALGRTMRDAWVHFATTGSMADAPPPVPAWPAYRPDNPAVLALATPPHVIDHRLPLDADWIPA